MIWHRIKWLAGSSLFVIMVGNILGQDAQRQFFEGYELLLSGKAAEAAAMFERGLMGDPKNAISHFYLGEAYLRMGQRKNAQTQWRIFLGMVCKTPAPARAAC